MTDVSSHYVHCVVKRDFGEGVGWYSPAEVDDDATDFCFAIPLRGDGAPFPEGYWIEVLLNDGKRELLCFSFVARDGGRFALDHQSGDILFQEIPAPPNERTLPYRGRFRHDDFAFSMLGLEPLKDTLYDLMLSSTEAFLVGCHPATHYGGAK